MDLNLIKYQITPRVVEVGKKVQITVKALEKAVRFFDDVEYQITVIRTDGWKYVKGKELNAGGRDLSVQYRVRPVDGTIKFDHVYDIEGEWEIRITALNVDAHVPERFVVHWPAGKNRMLAPMTFRIYALEKDLYGKKAFKGELHAHTFESDGFESPEFTVARYRKEGFDFMAITDHYYMDPSFFAVDYYKDFTGGIKLFPGEEVHPIKGGGIFHVVNFNGKWSVNELYDSNPEKANAEIDEIAKTFDLGDPVDNREIAFFKWIFDKIRESGGVAIYPHAYWQIGCAYHVRKKISHEILTRKLCDAYEVFGGMGRMDNRLMTQLYAELAAEGVDLPIIGASDSHSTLRSDLHFNDFFTLVFSEDKESVPECILNGQTVVVDNLHRDDKVVYGKLRLSRYAYFLLDQYFSVHDELCRSAGVCLTRYALGITEEKSLVELLESKVDQFEKTFFGF